MKWIGWLLKLCITIVMVSLLTVLTTGYVVNYYVGSLLASYNIPISSSPSIGNIVTGMLGLSGQKSNNNNKSVTSEGSSNGKIEQDNEPDQPVTGDNNKGTPSDSDGDIPDDALPVMGGNISGERSHDQQVVVSPDDLVAKKDELKSTEKEEVFAILMSKLPENEMRRLTEAMEGGLTETEIMEIEQILSKYLNKEEYAKMMKILQD
jgi:hypothetical protein